MRRQDSGTTVQLCSSCEGGDGHMVGEGHVALSEGRGGGHEVAKQEIVADSDEELDLC